MFDNLRDEESSSSPLNAESVSELFPDDVEAAATGASSQKADGKILGMTAVQRFIIVVMLMVAVCTLGAMCLLLTGKIGLV